MKEKKLKIGIPKGSLQKYTIKIFKLAGFNIEILKRSYILKIDEPKVGCFLLRPQEIPKYVERGKLDLGISGDDWIAETKAEVIQVCDLRYAKQKIKKIRWVLAVPEDSKIKSVKDLEGKTISTEVVNLVEDYLKKNKVEAKVEFSWGATEVKPPLFADAIVDLIETGVSLRVHNLKILDIIFESSTKLIANKKSWEDEWKRERIEDLALLLKGAVESEEAVSMMMHVSKGKLKRILETFLESKTPTVKKIAGGGNWYDVSFSCKEKEARELIPKLKRMGCEGIVEFPLNKIIP